MSDKRRGEAKRKGDIWCVSQGSALSGPQFVCLFVFFVYNAKDAIKSEHVKLAPAQIPMSGHPSSITFFLFFGQRWVQNINNLLCFQVVGM